LSFNVHNWSSSTLWGILVIGLFLIFIAQAVTPLRPYWAWFCAALLAADIGLFVFFAHFDPKSKSTPIVSVASSRPIQSPMATDQTSSGNNSANINQANQGGVNNLTVNYGLTPDIFQAIKDGMIAAEKRRKDDLLKTFPMGYVLFTITDRNQFVPNGSPLDQIVFIDWTTLKAIEVSEKSISFLIPTIYLMPPGGGFSILDSCAVTVPRDTQSISKPFAMAGYVVGFKYLEDLGGNPILVMGIFPQPH